jgi:hypothetical protein
MNRSLPSKREEGLVNPIPSFLKRSIQKSIAFSGIKKDIATT